MNRLRGKDWEAEMNRMSRTDQLKVILNRLKEYKRQGGQDGIDEKIREVERDLKEELKRH